MDYSLAIYNYERYLLGATDKLKIPGDSTDQQEKEAKECFRYAVVKLLEWTPEEAAQHMTPDIMKLLHLDNLLHYIKHIPDDCDQKNDLDYLVSWILGVPVNRERFLLRYTMRLKTGEAKKYPEQLFKGPEGQKNATYLLMEQISTSIATHGSKREQISQLYAKFGNQAKAKKFLKSKGLYYVFNGMYNTPIEYLHNSLNYQERDEFLFGFYNFDNAYKNVSKSKKKKAKK